MKMVFFTFNTAGNRHSERKVRKKCSSLEEVPLPVPHESYETKIQSPSIGISDLSGRWGMRMGIWSMDIV